MKNHRSGTNGRLPGTGRRRRIGLCLQTGSRGSAAWAVCAIALAALLSGCASKSASSRGARENALASAPVAESNAQLPKFRIKDWSAVNDHLVIITADDGTRYRAETLGPCIGLNFANRLAFVNRGGFEQVDRFSSLVLGDGTRCSLQSFDKLKAPEAQALDSYEKSEEKKDDETKDEKK